MGSQHEIQQFNTEPSFYEVLRSSERVSRSVISSPFPSLKTRGEWPSVVGDFYGLRQLSVLSLN